MAPGVPGRYRGEAWGRGRRRAYLAREWHEVVFAETRDIDVAHKHHFIVVLFEYGIVDDVYEAPRRANKSKNRSTGIAGSGRARGS